MDMICQPLVETMKRSWFQIVLRIVIGTVIIGILISATAQLSVVGTHFTAITRLFAIKLLPLWNWQDIYRDNCMINNPFSNPITGEDCVVSFVFIIKIFNFIIDAIVFYLDMSNC